MLEKPTPIERLVQLIPFRYPLATLAWVIILGPISFELANFLQNGTRPPYFPAPLNALAGSVLLFYVFYVVRYVRLKIAGAEPVVVQIMQGGEVAYQSIFGRVTKTRPILLLTIFLEALAFLSTLQGRSFSITSGLDVITQVLLILAFATLIWEYSVSNWGLHKLGTSHLKLKSFLEDRFMGAKTIGNLALSLTSAYLVGVLLFFLDTLTFLSIPLLLFAIFYLVLLALGITMFFLPLDSLHKKMLTEKIENQRELSREFLAIKNSYATGSADASAASQTVEESVTQLVRLKDLEMTENRLGKTPTWPFDIQLLAKLVTIVLSVTAVLLTRLITDYLIHI